MEAIIEPEVTSEEDRVLSRVLMAVQNSCSEEYVKVENVFVGKDIKDIDNNSSDIEVYLATQLSVKKLAEMQR